jgi:hypothetical protein
MISGMDSNLPYRGLLAFRHFIRPFNEIIRAVSSASRRWTALILDSLKFNIFNATELPQVISTLTNAIVSSCSYKIWGCPMVHAGQPRIRFLRCVTHLVRTSAGDPRASLR